MDSSKIVGAVQGVTKKWAKQRKAEERRSSAEANRRYRLTASYRATIRDVAYNCMEDAYMKASSDGKFIVYVRQVFYQMRPMIYDATGRELKDQYFCQNLLPDYMAFYKPGWDVVFDERGRFYEPHTGTVVGLGTLGVRKYLNNVGKPTFSDPSIAGSSVETHGPEHRYGAILFIEKEGFMPLFEQVQLAEKFDIAIMSTKGMSNVAARTLEDAICSRHQIPFLVLHDFDKSGFSIRGTLERDTRRFTFQNSINVIDLGLRLEDVETLGLQSEPAYDRGDEWSRMENLRENGATETEIEFLLRSRVELNALTSDQLIDLIERKLTENDVRKIVPDTDALAEAYRRSVANKTLQDSAEDLIQQAREEAADASVPEDLNKRVDALLAKRPTMSWDDAVREVAEDDAGEDGEVS